MMVRGQRRCYQDQAEHAQRERVLVITGQRRGAERQQARGEQGQQGEPDDAPVGLVRAGGEGRGGLSSGFGGGRQVRRPSTGRQRRGGGMHGPPRRGEYPAGGCWLGGARWQLDAGSRLSGRRMTHSPSQIWMPGRRRCWHAAASCAHDHASCWPKEKTCGSLRRRGGPRRPTVTANGRQAWLRREGERAAAAKADPWPR
jgi:hypothetical protein